ncbi:DUF3732 domain-containing protein [Brevibacillus centrosporus]|uniref:DUF3732 domain-containing protein n=1 Tax=Brevibacillus centrosporus TaxID=54910 RepID=UPI003D20B670
MSIQLKEIILYNKDGKTRVLPFFLGKVNIITGKSKAGKSAIIEIVEYCLGRSDFRVPDGVVRNTVTFYAIKLKLNETEIFIAKAPPEGNNASQSQIYLEIGENVGIPSMSMLVPNSNDEALVDYLGSLIGISQNLHTPKLGESRSPLEANFKHARTYLFQKQSIIANESVLFHRQNEPFMPQSIKDTLPYFLGVIREDQLRLEQELRTAKRDLKLAHRKLDDAKLLSGKGVTNAYTLIDEAKQVGLINEQVSFDTIDEIIGHFNYLVLWKPSPVPVVEVDQLDRLQDERRGLIERLGQVNESIRAAEAYASEAVGYSDEAVHQRLRLETIGLFEKISDDKAHTCPLCSSYLEQQIPSIEQMQLSLSLLNQNLEAVDRERPKLRDYIEKLSKERNDIKTEIEEVVASINALLVEQETAIHIQDQNTRAARIVGRISLFVENYEQTQEDSSLEDEIKVLERRIEALEEALDTERKEEILSSTLSRLSLFMTQWAKDLELEHSNSPYRLDIKNLTVVADQEERPIPMYRMGSGENWLGCHLISHLALHKYFIQKNRPVPGFLILDQPTQVYFPAEKYVTMEGNADELTDEDRLAVKRLYQLLFDVCTEMAPHLQIIVLDHANLIEPSFQEALIEDPWRNGRALIPQEWII